MSQSLMSSIMESSFELELERTVSSGPLCVTATTTTTPVETVLRVTSCCKKKAFTEVMMKLESFMRNNLRKTSIATLSNTDHLINIHRVSVLKV